VLVPQLVDQRVQRINTVGKRLDEHEETESDEHVEWTTIRRVNSDERAILETAAELAHTNLSDFMRRKALESAETEVLNRTIVTIPAKDWEAFEAWVNRPAEPNPALTELARRRPTWDK